MKRRINLLLELIEDAKSNGVKEEKLEETMLVNGIAEPGLTRKYLRYLEGFGKVVREDGTFYSANYRTDKTVQAKLDSEVTHTSHTHEESRD